jgi:hypothetical protein
LAKKIKISRTGRYSDCAMIIVGVKQSSRFSHLDASHSQCIVLLLIRYYKIESHSKTLHVENYFDRIDNLSYYYIIYTIVIQMLKTNATKSVVSTQNYSE